MITQERRQCEKLNNWEGKIAYHLESPILLVRHCFFGIYVMLYINIFRIFSVYHYLNIFMKLMNNNWKM